MDETQDIRIEYNGDIIKAYAGNICLWDVIGDPEEPVIYNQAPSKIDLPILPIHYNDMNTRELYKSYQKILEIIERFDKQKTMNKRAPNYHDRWSMDDLRSYCQVWLDDVRFRQDGKNRWWIWDRIKYFLKGQLKQRKLWLHAFGTICYDMCQRLDAIDGGNEAQNADQMAPRQHRIGFNN